MMMMMMIDYWVDVISCMLQATSVRNSIKLLILSITADSRVY